ncbi:peptidase [Mycena floridula]|nr:peptidase [Mycena floridula]
MKASFISLLTFVGLAVATPLFTQVPMNEEYPGFNAQVAGLFDQVPLDIHKQYPGFSLDLNEERLVQMEGQEPVWMTEWEKIKAKAQGIKFFDITDTRDLDSYAQFRTSLSFPSTVNATEKVYPILKTLKTKNMKGNLEKFTSFRTRYYRSDTGRQSQQWLLSRIDQVTAEYASQSLRELITYTEFPHAWGQNSIILRIQGSSETDDSVVVVGAHQDSTNMFPFLPAPGADDDGSGSVTIFEAYRALLEADFTPVRTVEFHWYSAEEGGLLGSQAVAKAYAAEGINVLAMSQFDMTAWVKAGSEECVGIITDFVDPDLTAFNKLLVDEYLDIPYVETQCGYACSDHASWAKAGYASSFTIESAFEDSNKHIHSTGDRIDVSPEFSFEHMLEFSKLVVAFAIELAGWE